MSQTLLPQTVYLRRGELLRIDEQKAAWLSVVRGRVWVTQIDDPDDHFLERGQSMRVEAGALALASAEGGPAELAVAYAAARAEQAEPAGPTIGVPEPALQADP